MRTSVDRLGGTRSNLVESSVGFVLPGGVALIRIERQTVSNQRCGVGGHGRKSTGGTGFGGVVVGP